MYSEERIDIECLVYNDQSRPPDWEGELLIILSNHSNNIVELKYEETFCTVIFLENLSASTKARKKEAGRTNLLKKEWYKKTQKSNEEFQKMKQKTIRKRRIYLTIIPLSFFLGIIPFFFDTVTLDNKILILATCLMVGMTYSTHLLTSLKETDKSFI